MNIRNKFALVVALCLSSQIIWPMESEITSNPVQEESLSEEELSTTEEFLSEESSELPTQDLLSHFNTNSQHPEEEKKDHPELLKKLIARLKAAPAETMAIIKQQQHNLPQTIVHKIAEHLLEQKKCIPSLHKKFSGLCKWSDNGNHLAQFKGTTLRILDNQEAIISEQEFPQDTQTPLGLNWSPDSKQLALANHRHDEASLTIIGPDFASGIATCRVAEIPEAMAWSPNSQLIALVGKTTLSIYERNGHQRGAIQIQPTDYTKHITWSHDGEFFCVCSLERATIYSAQLKEITAISREYRGSNILKCEWSPTSPCFVITRGLSAALYSLDDTKIEQKQINLPTLGCSILVFWAPDGQKFLIRGDNAAYIMNLNTELLSANLGKLYEAVWSPNGELIALYGKKENRIIKNGDHSLLAEIDPTAKGTTIRKGAWHPSGKALLSSGVHSVYIVNTSGEVEKRIYTNLPEVYQGWWSPDYQYVVVRENGGQGRYQIHYAHTPQEYTKLTIDQAELIHKLADAQKQKQSYNLEPNESAIFEQLHENIQQRFAELIN